MTRTELDALLLKAYFAQKSHGPSMLAHPEKYAHAMAEPAWQHIEALRGLLREARKTYIPVPRGSSTRRLPRKMEFLARLDAAIGVAP
jgi:hypothetical protein